MQEQKGFRNQLRRLRSFFLPRMWDLRLELRRIERIYTPLIAALHGEKKQEMIGECFMERGLVTDELDQLRSQHILRKASCLDVAIPKIPHGSDREEDDNWERSSISGRWILKAGGRQLIRKQIREEQKFRFEELTRWVSFLVPILFGLIGAATGLVAILMR